MLFIFVFKSVESGMFGHGVGHAANQVIHPKVLQGGIS